MTHISPLKPNVGRSSTSIGQASTEFALSDVWRLQRQNMGCCQSIFTKTSSKKEHLVKMLCLTLAPIVVLVGVAIYFTSESAVAKKENSLFKEKMEYSLELGKILHFLQQERDSSVLYLSNLGSRTKLFLLQQYEKTDEALDSLSGWSFNFGLNKAVYFKEKRLLASHIGFHRNELRYLNHTIYDEINFYSDIINVFEKWLYEEVTESRYGTLWKSLVSYQKVVISKKHAGVERALGTAYLARGGFPDADYYSEYIKEGTLSRFTFETARRYSDFVKPLAYYNLTVNGNDLLIIIDTFRSQIQMNNITGPSLQRATGWYDAMSFLMDQLLTIQEGVAEQIKYKIDKRSNSVIMGVVTSSFVIIIAISLCPVMCQCVIKMTDDIQNYNLTLVDKTKELNKEKKRTDSLLHQMLPKTIAEQLKRKKDVQAEYFKEVTIFFSDIVGFTNITQDIAPLQVVELLNNLYTLFDERIGRHDVYKVETINDSYMVASGVPSRNVKKHANEIANMSLDLLIASCELEFPNMPGKHIRIKIGVHTGPVVAGIVGSKLPRYCLFGDTVNTASRMESTSLPNRIHVSEATYNLLSNDPAYHLCKRGEVKIKGKGVMTSYWLMGKDIPTDSESQRTSTDTWATLRVSRITNRSSDVSGSSYNTCRARSGLAFPPTSLHPLYDAPDDPQPSTSANFSGNNPAFEKVDETDDIIEMENEQEPIPYEELYKYLDKTLEERKGSPPIFQLTEGYHY